MSKKHIIDAQTGVEEVVDFTPEEQTQFDTDVAKSAQEKTDRDASEAQKATNKASAKAKLIAGEPLTEDEADTIVL